LSSQSGNGLVKLKDKNW